MLESIITYYEKYSRKNSQYIEYVSLLAVVTTLSISGKIGLFIADHPIYLIDLFLKIATLTSLLLPTLVTLELWRVNRDAKILLKTAPGCKPHGIGNDGIANNILKYQEEWSNFAHDRQFNITTNAIIGSHFRRKNGVLFLYMLPAFFAIMSSYMLILYFNSEIRTHNSLEVRELHGTYTEFLVNLMWATIALQIVSTFAIKAALSDLRSAIETWLMSGQVVRPPASSLEEPRLPLPADSAGIHPTSGT